jgi:hypothetical protein
MYGEIKRKQEIFVAYWKVILSPGKTEENQDASKS